MQFPQEGRGWQDGREPRDLLPPGTPVDLTNCDREPIHIPSAIQPHGVLIAARAADLHIVYISENSEDFLRVTPAAALAMTLEELLGEEPVRTIRGVIDREQYTPCEALTLSLPSRNGVRFDVLPHALGGLIYVELEISSGEQQWEVISNRMQLILGSLRRQQTIEEICESAVKHVRSLAGYDRVMVYRFDRDGHGEVIAEDKDEEMEPLLGLHYPATDIPQQARQLYLIQRVRAIVDVDYVPAAVLAGAEVAGQGPLDMSYCWLRSVSPLHVEYLHNMGVTASLAISLIHDDELWGMIVCHHRTPHRPGVMVRALADLIGKLMSLLLGVAGRSEGYADQLLRQELMQKLGSALRFEMPIVEVLASHGAGVLRATGSDGACVRLGGRTQLIGSTPDQAEVEAIAAALRPHLVDGMAATDRLGELSPDLAYLAPVASGVLKARIHNEPGDAVLWFRGEQVQTVRWAGDPDVSKSISPETGDLRPRHSFAVWKQTQRGRSLPWEAADYASAQALTRLIAIHLLRQSESEMAQLSRCDALTNLPNRRVLLEQLSHWRDSRTSEPAALLFLDIDNFKTVNDSLGHAIGDELLVQVSRRLSEAVEGTTHLVARLGGDEFVVFCRDTPVEEAERLAERIVKSFATPFMIEGRPFRTSTSIGIAPLDACTTADPSDPLRAADSAMYVAKQRGGNQASVYESPQHERVLRQLQLEQGLFGALERGELQVEYQPQLACTTARVTGFEALLRWHHPVYGPIAPSEFIPLAERLGTIVPIGDWVLREALRQLKLWHQCFHAGLTVSVNVSANQVIKAEFGAMHRGHRDGADAGPRGDTACSGA
jgi:diguanylate cyclase (GGDEF)-like protein